MTDYFGPSRRHPATAAAIILVHQTLTQFQCNSSNFGCSTHTWVICTKSCNQKSHHSFSDQSCVLNINSPHSRLCRHCTAYSRLDQAGLWLAKFHPGLSSSLPNLVKSPTTIAPASHLYGSGLAGPTTASAHFRFRGESLDPAVQLFLLSILTQH